MVIKKGKELSPKDVGSFGTLVYIDGYGRIRKNYAKLLAYYKVGGEKNYIEFFRFRVYRIFRGSFEENFKRKEIIEFAIIYPF